MPETKYVLLIDCHYGDGRENHRFCDVYEHGYNSSMSARIVTEEIMDEFIEELVPWDDPPEHEDDSAWHGNVCCRTWKGEDWQATITIGICQVVF